MIFKCIPTGMFSSNCYIAGDNGECLVIDPGVDCKDILENIEKDNLKIKYIILTHGHIDHICSMDKLREKTGALILIHEADMGMLNDQQLNGSALFGEGQSFRPADTIVKGGDVLEVGGFNCEIIHTPGHTPGGICIRINDCIFTGDTLFKRSIGRTDLGNGNYKDIIKSITEKLMAFGDDVEIYPGHGPASTIGYERKNNPFIQGRDTYLSD